MSGTIHAQPAQVTDRLELAVRRSADGVRGDRLGGKCALARPGEAVCRGKVAIPVADPVGVAGPDEDLNAGLDDR
jgi:hypothetical protein